MWKDAFRPQAGKIRPAAKRNIVLRLSSTTWYCSVVAEKAAVKDGLARPATAPRPWTSVRRMPMKHHSTHRSRMKIFPSKTDGKTLLQASLGPVYHQITANVCFDCLGTRITVCVSRVTNFVNLRTKERPTWSDQTNAPVVLHM